MIVCVCNNISDREIKRLVENGTLRFGELQTKLGVSTNCGTCKSLAKEILRNHASSLRSNEAGFIQSPPIPAYQGT